MKFNSYFVSTLWVVFLSAFVVPCAVNAQSTGKTSQGGTTAGKPNATARKWDPPPKEFEKMGTGLTSPQGKQDGGGGPGDPPNKNPYLDDWNCPRFEFKNLEVDIFHLTEMEVDDDNLTLDISCPVVVPRKVPAGGVVGNSFSGTIYIPKGEITKRGQTQPSVALGSTEVVLVNLTTGNVEGRTLSGADGKYSFARVSPGPKAVFFRDKKVGLLHVANVQACKIVDKDGKGCTDEGIPTPKGKPQTVDLRVEQYMANHYYRVKGKTFPKPPPRPLPTRN